MHCLQETLHLLQHIKATFHLSPPGKPAPHVAINCSIEILIPYWQSHVAGDQAGGCSIHRPDLTAVAFEAGAFEPCQPVVGILQNAYHI